MQNLCSSYLLEREQGIHVWGTDVMKLALYTPAAVLNPKLITAYSALNEVVGTGYAAGGVVLALAAGFPKLSPSGASKVLIDFDDVVINPANGFTFHYGLIYNFSKANRAVAVIDFGIDLPVNVSLSIIWPTPDDNNAIIRLGA